ncbi:MAG: riboflavin synthase [Rhodospirillales bacterium]|nr:riboflavin synthase [Rhodospirillales bacterium]
MFTGIVADLGTVRDVREVDSAGAGADRRLEITTALPAAEFATGASISCSGICLTVIDRGADWFAVTVSAETLSRTTVGAWRVGTAVNLERSVRLGDELGGHLVSGHVDGLGTLTSAMAEGASRRMVFAIPEPLRRHVAEKGSIAVDGVSLTVNEVDNNHFGVNIIPHTLNVTTLGRLQVGDRVNIEIDLLARYVARFLETA